MTMINVMICAIFSIVERVVKRNGDTRAIALQLSWIKALFPSGFSPDFSMAVNIIP